MNTGPRPTGGDLNALAAEINAAGRENPRAPRPIVLISGRGPYTTTCTTCADRHTTGSIAAARAWRAHHTATCTGRSTPR